MWNVNQSELHIVNNEPVKYIVEALSSFIARHVTRFQRFHNGITV